MSFLIRLQAGPELFFVWKRLTKSQLEQVVIEIQKVDHSFYLMSAYHRRGSKLFFVDSSGGEIQEMDRYD